MPGNTEAKPQVDIKLALLEERQKSTAAGVSRLTDDVKEMKGEISNKIDDLATNLKKEQHENIKNFVLKSEFRGMDFLVKALFVSIIAQGILKYFWH